MTTLAVAGLRLRVAFKYSHCHNFSPLRAYLIHNEDHQFTNLNLELYYKDIKHAGQDLDTLDNVLLLLYAQAPLAIAGDGVHGDDG